MRRTKIVATVGPASSDPDVLRSMIGAGLDVARIGLAHGTLDDHLAMYWRLRDAAEATGSDIGILIDLPGPKVRCARFADGGTALADGQAITVVAGTDASDSTRIEIDYESVASDVMVGDQLAIGDGNITLMVEGKSDAVVDARIIHGGLAQGRPGFQIPSERLRLSTPTAEDLEFVDAFVDVGVDMIAVSFVRSAHDMRGIRTQPAPAGPLLVAKIETRAAVENLDGIIETSDAVMVARGDLGLDFPIAELPHLQKHIIGQCVARSRPVITATQMLESMVHSTIPTRAEATDVANAVFDGTSAVMLSGETAIGDDPVNAIETMARITERADEEFDRDSWIQVIQRHVGDDHDAGSASVRTDALSLAACEIAEKIGAMAILCLTRTGFTAQSITRFRPEVQVLAFTPDSRTARQLRLSWGTTPTQNLEHPTSREVAEQAMTDLRERNELMSGDLVVVVSGQSLLTRSTDTLRVVTVP